LHRSQSPITILNHLLSQPVPEFSHSLEVIYEYLLIRENKLKEKKAGKGGKGTLSREALEDISARLTEIEHGLSFVNGRKLEKEELDEARALGMTLVLSLRMSFSYFTLPELAAQLLLVAVPVCEGLLVQHIRRRVEGEGRWAVGNELEHLERMVSLHWGQEKNLTARLYHNDQRSRQLSARQKLELRYRRNQSIKSPYPHPTNRPASSSFSPFLARDLYLPPVRRISPERGSQGQATIPPVHDHPLRLYLPSVVRYR
jgi:hypothetical protein